MDPSKKRKADENGTVAPATAPTTTTPVHTKLTADDARKIIESFTQDQLIETLRDAVVSHPAVLASVRAIADRDASQRKLFVRGLGWDTTTDSLRTLFSEFGEIDEAIVILDKATGKSKGYGFVIFKHIDGAIMALKEPSKKIDGRMTVTQLAAAGVSGNVANSGSGDVSLRKIYVGNVPFDIPSEKLLGRFSEYGEIEEGPLGFDKTTGKSRGFAFFVYKTEEGAKRSLIEPIKHIDGNQIICKLAGDGKKGKVGAPAPSSGVGGHQAPIGEVPIERIGAVGAPPLGQMPVSMPISMSSITSQYSTPGGLSVYGGYAGGLYGPPAMAHHQQPMNSGLPSSIGAQVPSGLGPTGGYGVGLGGSYGASQYGGPPPGEYGGGYGNSGASSMYRLPPSSVGVPTGVYPDSGHFGLSSSAYNTQHHQPAGVTPTPRVPPGGLYQGMPPYY